METVTAKDAHLHLGKVLDDSQLNPIEISKNGKAFSVLLSARDFEELGGIAALETLRLRKQIDLRLARSEEIGGDIPHEQVIAEMRKKYGG